MVGVVRSYTAVAPRGNRAEEEGYDEDEEDDDIGMEVPEHKQKEPPSFAERAQEQFLNLTRMVLCTIVAFVVSLVLFYVATALVMSLLDAVSEDGRPY